MHEADRRRPQHNTYWITGLLVLALAVRLTYNIGWVGIDDVPVFDALNYHHLGMELVESGRYINLHRAPGLPFLIAGIYGLFDVHPFYVRIVLSILGTLTCGLIYLIGRDAFSRRVGLWAAGAGAVYIFLFHWNGYLLTETLFTCLLCLFIRLLLKGLDTQDLKYWMAAGFALGLATLTRPITLVFGPFLMIWALISFYPNIKYAMTVTGLMLLVMVLTIMPWTIRNYYAAGALIPVSQASGNVLLGANNPRVLDHFPGGWIEPLESGLVTEAETEGLSAVELDRLYMQKGLSFILGNPLYTARLCAYKFKSFWHLHRAVNPESIQYILVALSAAYGAVVAWPLRRRISILYIMPVFFTLMALVFWGDDRMRSPVEPVLLIFAAAAWTRFVKIPDGDNNG